MTLEDIILEFRNRTQDLQPTYLWSDEEIAGFADDAVNEACERARLIEDKTTPAVCSVPLVIGVSDYALHESVFAIKRVTCRGRKLVETSVEELDMQDQYWENRASSPPYAFIYGQGTTLRAFPTPTATDTLALTVYRFPLIRLSMDNTDAQPEIPTRLHLRLMDWMYFRAYSKQDAETFDKVRAERAEAAFTNSFGIRVDANVQRKHRDKQPPIVRFKW